MINDREILQELIKNILEFVSNKVSFELGLLETIVCFVIYQVKKVLIFTGNVLKIIN